METGIVYKIRNKDTGLYSNGLKGGKVNWSKKGRTWSEIGHVKSSISQAENFKRRWDGGVHPYSNSELLVYKIEQISNVDVLDMK